MVDVYNHVKHCTTHPKFLHSNSTSHRWVFGAIAELIDNAIDPDVSASQFCIDMKEFNGEPCLVFMDNGCGLVPEKLHKMLSFGHSKKQMTPGDRSIGKHGNGFKSGTMRLGKDVLVLTKCANSMTAGFLSQTFLAETGAEDILIPQVSWDLDGNRLSPMDLEIEESLRAICKYSIFPDEDSLLAQLEAIPVTGAILIISNLRRHEGVLELDFETDPHDIRITSEINSSHFQQLRPNQPNSTEVQMDYSLRAYVSILYKVPRMQIFIRDKKVKTKRIAGILSLKETETYKPYGVAESIKIELGFNTENKNLYGMMLYHRNRLIKAYMRVGMQLEENEKGMGVIGLAEADFLQPTHNKQDFDDTTAYRRLLKKLSDVLSEYWWEKKERVPGPQVELEPRALRRGINVSTSEDVPDVIWVQCDNPACLKWRILPPGTDATALPDIWYCEYHPDAKFRRHEEPEQEWDPSVQHEIIERRKERKREYDREKKEREAERKRQRLEAANRDTQEALQKQREALAKELQDQEAREELALKDQKRREEEMKKLNQEYEVMQAKRDEMLHQQQVIERQLELAQEELARKAKEKEDSALLSALMVHPAVELQEPSLPPRISENGHGGGSSRSVTASLEKKKTGRPRDGTNSATLRHLSPAPHVNQPTLLSNGNLHGRENNGAHSMSTLGISRLATTPRASPWEIANGAQACQPSQVTRTSFVDLSRELILQATSTSQMTQCKEVSIPASGRTNGIQCASLEHRKRLTKVAQPSQRSEGSPAQELRHSSKRPEIRVRVPSGEVATPSVAPVPPIPSTPCSPSLHESLAYTSQQTSNPALHTTSGFAPALSQESLRPPTSSLEKRPSVVTDPANHDLLSPQVAPHGPPCEHRIGDLATEDQSIQQFPESHRLKDMGNEQPANCGSGAPLTGLRLIVPQGQKDVRSTGLIAVHLPMDAMEPTSNSSSEGEITLDKAVFSLQRHLRLALNTLVRLGGSTDTPLFELDVLPSQDDEVISICQKAKQHVETRMQNYRQEVASLKAELAYLMADKTQHGQGLNFKIQSVATKWGIGMDVPKRS